MKVKKNTFLDIDIDPENLIESSVKDNVKKVLNSGRLFRYDGKTPQDSETSLLEKDFADFIGSKYAIAVNSCSSAIFLSLLCTGVKPGDKVFIPAFTFSAVPSAVVHASAIPFLIDIDENYSIDIDDFKRKAKDNPDVKHLLLSYMRGHVPNLDLLCEICESCNIKIIEDCAHSVGMKWDGKMIGSFGESSAFSMQSYKMIDGGEGGILSTNSDEIAAKAILYAGSYELNWRKHFLKKDSLLEKYQTKIPNFNFRMSNLSAGAIRPQIPNLGKTVKSYNEKYLMLLDLLKDSPHIRIPKRHKKLEIAADSMQFNLIGMDKSTMIDFVDLCSKKGLDIQIMGIAMNNARCFWNWQYLENTDHNSCKKTKEILNSTCDFRLRHFFDKENINTIAELILETLDEVN